MLTLEKLCVKQKDAQNNTLKCKSYSIENTLLLHYKDKPVMRYETNNLMFLKVKRGCEYNYSSVLKLCTIF
jgi:hypothetical protein